MTIRNQEAMSWFPYDPRPQQDNAVRFAATVYSQGTVGLLSAACGVGKTIAVLSGYLAARIEESDSRLFILTRTHSQSDVFEEEIRRIRQVMAHRVGSQPLTATSLISRIHLCPIKERIVATSVTGFTKGCNDLVRSGQCTYYYGFYQKSREDGRPQIRARAKAHVESLLHEDIVTREHAESTLATHDFCPYEVLRWCAKNSRIIIGPYSYIFNWRVRNALLTTLSLTLPEIDILVDEAHNLADHILESETASITGSDILWLKNNASELKRVTRVDWLPDVVSFLWETLMIKLDRLRSKRELELHAWEVIPRFIKDMDLQFLAGTKGDTLDSTDVEASTETPLERLIGFLVAGAVAAQNEGWHCTLEIGRRWTGEFTPNDARLMIRPLNAAGLLAPTLRGARSVLLMSGTLNPIHHYASLLGIKTARTESIAGSYPSGSRLVLIDRKLSTKYTERGPALWSEIAKRITKVLAIVPANKSALIAFPSYSILNDVLAYGIDCSHRSLIVEEPRARIEDVKAAVESAPHAIFGVYSGKFGEGIDLVHEGSSLIDLVIGVGIPFTPPTSFSGALRDWYEQKYGKGAGYYYSTVLPSIRKVAQLIGRLRRSPDDWGVVVLLDRRFTRHIDVFGEGIVSDIWPFTEPHEMISAIELFLANRKGGA